MIPEADHVVTRFFFVYDKGKVPKTWPDCGTKTFQNELNHALEQQRLPIARPSEAQVIP